MTNYQAQESFPISGTELEIKLVKMTEGPVNLLLIGGVHGDEPEGFFLVEKFMQSRELWSDLHGRVSLWVIPRLNPWGCAHDSRTNKNGVDLNRNMATKDWVGTANAPRYFPGPCANSEFETQTLIKIIEKLQPRLIVSAHSWNPMINYNGPCLKIAELMSSMTHYRLSDDIGYPTPGSLGTWAGWERKIPVITLEIERGTSQDVIWNTHASSLSEALKFASSHSNLE